MIALTNKQVSYSIASNSETFKLNGQVTVKEENAIIANFSGSFFKNEDEYCGNFYYSENNDGKASKSISDVSKDDFMFLDNFLDSSITELKETL
jgi:hypothetical protein